MAPLAKRVVTSYYPHRENRPHAGAKDWLWRCSICSLVYEKQTDAQACCWRSKFEKGIAWREPDPDYESARPIGLWMHGRIRTPLCYGCNKLLEGEDLAFAEEPGAHPGLLGQYCPACYRQAVEEAPDLPWTDPISGEVDYDEMASDLGFESERDWEDEDDWDL
jgi:hypothetical protein